MKKTISALLIICILMSVMSLSAFAVGEPTVPDLFDNEKTMLKIKRVDSNGDGNYSTDDAALILKAAAGISADSKDLKYDVDCDGSVSVIDAQKALKAVSGIEPAASQGELLSLFNEKMNSIKSDNEDLRPNFDKTSTVQCPSIKVTTTGAPLPGLNVSNMEYRDYVSTIERETKPLMAFLPKEDREAMQGELNKMKQSAVDAYKPQTVRKSILKIDSKFNNEYPVNTLKWVSTLTLKDIETVSYKYIDGDIIFNVRMGTVVHKGDEYPTGPQGFNARQRLPYGKIFTLVDFPETDGSRVNSMTFKNGAVSLSLDKNTDKPSYTHYSYTYIADVSAPSNNNLTMKMVTTSNVEENFVLYY